ncbi:glycosyl transferase [Spirochaetia bacterium]|nr:glycosyl transferase [Spirochaetia bacterium]
MKSGGLRTKDIIKQSKENMPLVTVITVVYNGGKTLEETILSVINQTYKNIEYIIIDGASKDNTLEIIKKYDDKIDYWISETDEGIYYAMNKGIDLATGEYINFMNSGDSFYDCDVVLSFISHIMNVDDNIAVFYGNTEVLFKSGHNKIITPPQIINGKMDRMKFGHQSSFTKLCIIKSRKFDTKYKIIADFDFFKFLYINKFIFHYVPIIISKYPTDGGISYDNPGKLLFEQYEINGYLNRRINYISCFFEIIYTMLKNILKGVIPISLLNQYRDRKFK